MIPFSPPHISEEAIQEVVDTLRSGWITTGPKTKKFEKELAAWCGNPQTLCLNSATAALEMMLRWLELQEGDEVILPAYTYSATANVVMHCGAKPVFVDTRADDFNISAEAIQKAITPATRVIMPVDFAGMPCDYDAIYRIVNDPANLLLFQQGKPRGKFRELGRIFVLSDAAHSFGALYHGRRTGSLADASAFSFHAVKNLTTAEGGALAFRLPAPFTNEEAYRDLCIKSLHGQTKDALAKMQKGNWKYDIVEPGYKCNMTDIAAALGLVGLAHYEETLSNRKKAVENYNRLLKDDKRFLLPLLQDDHRTSAWHLYPLRIKGISADQRDAVMAKMFEADVAVNVHFVPLPLLSCYKELGYKMEDFPVAYNNFSTEISLPLFYGITAEQQEMVVDTLIQACNSCLPA